MQIKRFVPLFFGLLLLSNPLIASSYALCDEVLESADNLYEDIKSDFGYYFQKNNLLVLGGTLVGASVLANTTLDQEIRNGWQGHVRGKHTRFLKHFCAIGIYNYKLTYLASTLIGGYMLDESRPCSPFNALYHWGYRSMRTLLLAGLQTEFFIWTVGAGRPIQNRPSRWYPFHSGNRSVHDAGVSGHTFNGAIPFITAGMMSEDPLYKYTFYAFSLLPGLSRINDNHHYTSQVIIGWVISFLSANAINKTEHAHACPYQIHAFPIARGARIIVHADF
jgi:membrane-associated phospholipid phosphatase